MRFVAMTGLGAYLRAMVLFPTPPLPLATTRTLSTLAMARFSMGPPRRGICGGGGRLGKP